MYGPFKMTKYKYTKQQKRERAELRLKKFFDAFVKS
jgi:hypothetical protein